MTTDFKATQVQTNKIIVTGSFANDGSNQLLIYNYSADDSGTPNQGVIDTAKFDTSTIGSDVFLFVSGGISTRGTAGSYGVTVVGGDLHVSGNLTVDGTSPGGGGGGGGNDYWQSTVAGEIFATGSLAAITGSLLAQFLSSSNGAQITGSILHGLNTIASSNNSHAQGDSTTASGNYSHAEGSGSTASADASHAEGTFTNASGQSAHAEGYSTTASGQYAHAEGASTTALGYYSHAEGDNTTSEGVGSHSEGSNTSAQGEGSHSEGAYTYSSGSWSHAEGRSTITSGTYSHAEGAYTLSSGYAAHAEGGFTVAPGDYSHAEGQLTVASGTYSHTEGLGTIASGSYQHVQGKFNIRGNDFSLFVIGDGTNDNDFYRSDIVRVNSGSSPGSGSFEVTGTVSSTLGFSGSLTRLTDGTPYLIAGGGVSISSTSNGPITITAATSGDYWQSTLNEVIFNTGSIRQGTAVTIDLPTTNSIIFSSQGSSRTYGGTSNAIISSDASSIRNTSGDPNDVKTNTIISNIYSEIDGDSAINQTLNNAIIAGGINKIDSGSQYNAIVGSGGTFISSGALFNGSLAAGDVYGSFASPTVFDNAAGSAIIAGGPNVISSSDGNTVVNSAVIGSNWAITSSFTYAIGDTVNAAQVLISASNGVEITGQTKFFSGLSGSLTQLANGTPYLIAGTGIQTSTGSNGEVTISTAGPGGLATGKQYVAPYTTTTSTTPIAAGQFSWLPADYSGLTSVTVRAIMSTDGTANHTGSLQVYNLTSGSYLDLLDTPASSKHFIITSSIPTLVTSSNLLTGITNFDNSSTAIYEVRVSGSLASSTFIGGVEIIFT